VANTQLDRNRRLQDSNRKKGLVQVKVWIPESRVDDLKELAAKWRKQ